MYAAHGIRCSTGFLQRLLIPEQMRLLTKRGHEVALHSEARDEAAFRAEVRALTEAGFPVRGSTCHGGIGSAGHLGSTTYEWVERAGLGYTEQLGRLPIIPHPALAAPPSAAGPCRRLGIMVMSGHESLDLTTVPRGHDLSSVAHMAALKLAAGGAVNIMNHPDIHAEQLRSLLAWLDLSDVWRATHDGITAWCRLTKYDATINANESEVTLNFDRPLPAPLVIDVLTTDGTSRITIAAGTASATIRRDVHATHSIPENVRTIEQAAADFRSSVAGPSRRGPAEVPDLPAAPRADEEHPVRAAIVARTLAEAIEARRWLRETRGIFRSPPPDIRLLTITDGLCGLAAHPDESASFLHTDARGLFDLVLLDPAFRLFDTAFGHSFIARLSRLAAPGGTLLLSDPQSKSAASDLSRSALERWFGDAGDEQPNNMLRFRINGAIPEPPSVLSWYGRFGAQLVLEELTDRADDRSLEALARDPLVREYLLPGTLSDQHVRGARSGDDAADAGSRLRNTIRSHAYLISGIGYKSALIHHMLEALMPGRTDLRLADIGGGFGALTAELLLSAPPARWSLGVCRDPAAENLRPSRALHAGLRAALGGRFRLSPGPAETFAFEDGYDVITFIGSLLYVRKDALSDLLARVWRALAPGGCLIVHENIRNPASARDFDVMFAAAELDERLSALGNIRYFHSQMFRELTADQAEEKTVFRALVKPAHGDT